MNSVKFVCNNFESMSENVKKDVLLLYGDSCFDGFKNRFTLEATVTYIKTSCIKTANLLFIYLFICLSYVF